MGHPPGNPGDSTALAAEGEAADFAFDPNAPQFLVLAYPTDTVAPNDLLFQIARHNFNSFVVKDFDLEQMSFGQLGMLLVKGFNSVSEAEHYRTLLGRSTLITLPEQVRPFIISEENFAKLISGGRTLEEYFRASGDASVEKSENDVGLTDADSDAPDPDPGLEGDAQIEAD